MSTAPDTGTGKRRKETAETGPPVSTERIIAGAFEAEATSGRAGNRVFGVLGEGTLPIIVEIDRRGLLRYCAAAREDGVVSMADGHARVSGITGLAAITHGPAFTNAMTALTEASRARTPLVLLVGAVPDEQSLGHPQRFHHAAAANAAGAEFVRVRSPRTVAVDVRRALDLARRQSIPVVFEVPTNFYGQADRQRGVLVAGSTTDVDALESELGCVRPVPDRIDSLIDELAGAEYPLILGGRGAVRSAAGPDLRELAELSGALLATTLPAKGLFAGDRFDMGICGGFSLPAAARLIGESDAIFAFGAALNPHTVDDGSLFGTRARVIQIDQDARAFGAWLRPAAAVHADASVTARAIIERWRHRGIVARDGWRTPEVAACVEADREPLPTDLAIGSAPDRRPATAGVEITELIARLDRIAPADRTVVVDGGHAATCEPTRRMWVPDGRSLVFPVNFGSIGLGLGAAIGAATARPDRPVYSFVGDGGLMMSMFELSTAVREQLPLVLVVMNDAAYGWEYHQMIADGMDPGISTIAPQDFAAIAMALGAKAFRVSSISEIDAVAEQVASPTGPVVLDVHIDRSFVTPWYAERFLPK